MVDSTGRSNTQIIDAVDERRKRAARKALDLSLNELADMYRSEELRIRPEYQRLFRWSRAKQSQFIESLILEMPVPPIFVIETEDGRWELIDGLQRLSTYLHFRGELEALELDPPIREGDKLELEECDIVKELNGLTYEALPIALQIRLKRHFLRVETVLRETDARFRYYMFKRLNTGGELLSEQEIRNCTIRLLGQEFNEFIIELSQDDDFCNCIETLSEDRRRQMGDIELVLRFFAFKNKFDEFRHDVADFMTDFMERVSDGAHERRILFDYSAERALFQKTFSLLGKTLGPYTCIRWLNDRYGGQFLMHHFEAISLGVAKVIDAVDLSNRAQIQHIKEALEEIKKDDEFRRLTTGGGQNSPGPYRRKIDFVADRVRSVL